MKLRLDPSRCAHRQTYRYAPTYTRCRARGVLFYLVPEMRRYHLSG